MSISEPKLTRPDRSEKQFGLSESAPPTSILVSPPRWISRAIRVRELLTLIVCKNPHAHAGARMVLHTAHTIRFSRF